jgi:hypothetical protein
MKRKGLLLIVACIMLFLLNNVFAAETAAPAAPAGEPSLLDMFHNPTPWLEMGADARLRYEHILNPKLNHDESGDHSNYERYRLRYWMKFKLDENVTFNVRWCMEPRTWQDPSGTNTDEINNTEIIWDIFNLTWKNMFELPLTMVAGRQEFKLGDGWLTGDGTPTDGSRTAYHDALRFTYNLREKTALDLIYIDQDPDTGHRLSAINPQDRYINNQQEHGAIVYLTDKSIENTQLEAYFMYRNDNTVDGTASNFTNLSRSRDADIYTYGAAIAGAIDKNWNYRVEGAFQNGNEATDDNPQGLYTKEHEDLRAYGGKANLEYSFKDELDNKLGVTFEYLSGDDPDTDRVESFDPMWGEYPQWSDLMQPTVYNNENGYITNLQRLALTHKIKPVKNMELINAYHLLWADENTSGAKFSDSGKFRGQLLTSKIAYTFTKNVKGYLQGEYFQPSDYYADTNQDHAVFCRANLEITF